jgi:hypothetical protein
MVEEILHRASRGLATLRRWTRQARRIWAEWAETARRDR